MSANSLGNKWRSPEDYRVEFCLVGLVLRTPPQELENQQYDIRQQEAMMEAYFMIITCQNSVLCNEPESKIEAKNGQNSTHNTLFMSGLNVLLDTKKIGWMDDWWTGG